MLKARFDKFSLFSIGFSELAYYNNEDNTRYFCRYNITYVLMMNKDNNLVNPILFPLIGTDE